MQNNVLLRNILLANSYLNVAKHETDKKKRSKAVGNVIGVGFLYLFIIAFFTFNALGYGFSGLQNSIPIVCGLMISLLCFFFTILKVNGYLYGTKDYEMIMSLPFSVKKIVSTRFFYMYFRNLPMIISISLPMMIVYGIFAKPAFYTYLIWIILSFVISILPMIVAVIIGTLITAAGAKAKHKNIVQIILTIAFVLFCIFARVFIERIMRNGEVEQTMTTLSNVSDLIKTKYFPVLLFEKSILNTDILSFVILVAFGIALYEGTFLIISKFYKKIISKLLTGSSSKNFKMESQKTRSVVHSIAYKEYKKFVASPSYFVNVAIGQILTVILAVAVLFIDFDKILGAITQGSPLTKQMFLPAVPISIYTLISMLSTTAVSLSLEGKNYWIVQSLPIDKMTLYRGKMLFNLYITVPFVLFANLTVGIACGGNVTTILLCLLTGFISCFFTTLWGMVCGIRFANFEWTNEIDIIKRGNCTAIYLLPNCFISMGLVVVAVVLGIHFNANLIIGIFALTYGILSLLCYLRVRSLSKK